MTSDKQKIADRIRKLFALGESSNQHEAELAMQKANELMQEYQISMTDVDLSEDGAILQEQYNVDIDFRLGKSVFDLVLAAANLYDGTASRRRAGRSRETGLAFTFYGTPTDINAMKMTFHHLYESWKSISKHDYELKKIDCPELNAQAFKRAHLFGYALVLRRRAHELASQRSKAVKSATGRDLVVVKGAALKEYMNQFKFSRSSTNMRMCGAGFQAGRERGAAAGFGGVGQERTLAITGRK